MTVQELIFKLRFCNPQARVNYEMDCFSGKIRLLIEGRRISIPYAEQSTIITNV